MKNFKTLILVMVMLFITPINIFADTSIGNEDMPPENNMEVTNAEDTLINNGEYMPSSVSGKKFTGTGTVVDYSINEQKSFFVIETKDKEIYYLIIDNEKQTDNAYFLREINENELKFDESSKKEEIQTTIQNPQPVKKKSDLIPNLIFIAILLSGTIYVYLHPEVISKIFKKKNTDDDIYIDDEDEEIDDELEDIEEQEE